METYAYASLGPRVRSNRHVAGNAIFPRSKQFSPHNTYTHRRAKQRSSQTGGERRVTSCASLKAFAVSSLTDSTMLASTSCFSRDNWPEQDGTEPQKRTETVRKRIEYRDMVCDERPMQVLNQLLQMPRTSSGVPVSVVSKKNRDARFAKCMNYRFINHRHRISVSRMLRLTQSTQC